MYIGKAYQGSRYLLPTKIRSSATKRTNGEHVGKASGKAIFHELYGEMRFRKENLIVAQYRPGWVPADFPGSETPQVCFTCEFSAKLRKFYLSKRLTLLKLETPDFPMYLLLYCAV